MNEKKENIGNKYRINVKKIKERKMDVKECKKKERKNKGKNGKVRRTNGNKKTKLQKRFQCMNEYNIKEYLKK